jgi:hypothetical protein
MTKRLAFTELAIRRAIAAARKEGIDVNAVTVRSDGSITVHKSLEVPLAPSDNEAERQRWTDIEA